MASSGIFSLGYSAMIWKELSSWSHTPTPLGMLLVFGMVHNINWFEFVKNDLLGLMLLFIYSFVILLVFIEDMLESLKSSSKRNQPVKVTIETAPADNYRHRITLANRMLNHLQTSSAEYRNWRPKQQPYTPYTVEPYLNRESLAQVSKWCCKCTRRPSPVYWMGLRLVLLCSHCNSKFSCAECLGLNGLYHNWLQHKIKQAYVMCFDYRCKYLKHAFNQQNTN